MGSVCCVAAKDRPLSSGSGGGALQRNPVCSPPWSFRRDNRRRVADEVEGSPYNVGSGNMSVDKMSLCSERGILSEVESPPGHFGTPGSQKSGACSGMDMKMMVPPPSETSLATHGSTEVKDLVDSPDIDLSTLPKPSFSTPLLSTLICDPSSARTRLLPPKTTPSRFARRSPGHQLFRQVSDSRILGSKSPNNYSISEGRSSFVLSTYSNDFVTGSHYASSDGGWSVNTFSEFVASSQRERWSFDSEHLGSSRRKFSGSSNRFSYTPVDQDTCGACSKPLTERSSIASYELPVAAVLACGHVYHAECLETMTPGEEKYEPICPICTLGEKHVAKMSRKALKAEAELKAKYYKRCKNRVVDSYLDGDCDSFVFQKSRKQEGKTLKMDPNSSTRGSSKPFLKRHFASLGSKWGKPLSKDSATKKGFWSRYRKD